MDIVTFCRIIFNLIMIILVNVTRKVNQTRLNKMDFIQKQSIVAITVMSTWAHSFLFIYKFFNLSPEGVNI